MRRISATELGKNLSDVLNRVHYRGETVLVERGGKPVCQIAPLVHIEDFTLTNLMEVLGSLGEPGSAYAEAVRAGIAEQDNFEGTHWPHSSTRASSSK